MRFRDEWFWYWRFSPTFSGSPRRPLQNAVLCAECDVVSDSPHDTCMVCGSRSLFNIARMFGGELSKERASLIAQEAFRVSSCDVVLRFPQPHRLQRRARVGSQELPVLTLEDNETDEVERGMLLGPKGR